MLVYFLITVIFTFVLTALFSRILIPKLKSLKVGQKILDIGPRWHKNKEGTPTMGGISFIVANIIIFTVVVIVALVRKDLQDFVRLIICFAFAIINGIIGVIDDRAKIFKKQNQGLTAAQKYLLQLVSAGLFLFFMTISGSLTTELYIPLIDVRWDLGWFYYVFSLVLITGIVNSVNLTDGIDGLASSVTFVVGGFFAVAAFACEIFELSIISALVIGATLGFLVYNFYPAKIFMGDTGSLYFGGMVVAMAYLLDNPVILLPVGIIYIIESFSVILQVGYFKLTHGKRLFKMAPIHHHFEKCGWSEIKVVFVFSLVTLAFCVLAWFCLEIPKI
ncbi:MAG: phospho-N-acetylmuramoyl-pentapeptide-transferase [Ruminococcaceae bacterium]|nr:phospho-N-acetylmuramoyl-pentapeptide-transferase [Oscillospiraceae bacterium]